MLTSITPSLRIIFVIALAGCVHANTTSGAAGQADRARTIPLSTYAGLLRSITVTVANSAHPFIFDTGGGETMITPDLASAIGCTPYGRAVGLRASGEQVAFQYCDRVLLRLGDIAVAHERVGVFDLKAILPAGVPSADGVVSLQSFRAQPMTIDLARERITLETADSLAVRTGARDAAGHDQGRHGTDWSGDHGVHRGAGGGSRVWLLLDSGNGDLALVAPHVARMAGLTKSEGEALIEFDGLGPSRLQARSREIIYDGVLGVEFMRHWIFTFDLASNRAWAAPAESPRL